MNLTKTQSVISVKTSQLLKSSEVLSILKTGKEQPILVSEVASYFPQSIANLTRVRTVEAIRGDKSKTLISSYTVKKDNKLLTYIADFKHKSITCVEEIFDANNNLVKKITGKIRNTRIKKEVPSSQIFEHFANFYNNCEQFFITKFKDGKPLNISAVIRELNPETKTESIKMKQILKNGKATPYGKKLKKDASYPVERVDTSTLNDGKEETLTNIKVLLCDKRVARANYKRGFHPQFHILNESAAEFQNGVNNLHKVTQVYSLPLTDVKSDLLIENIAIKTGNKVTTFFKSFMNAAQKIIEVNRGKDGQIKEKTVSYLPHACTPKHKSVSKEHVEELKKLSEKVRIKLITKFKNGKPLNISIEAIDKDGRKIRLPWSDEYKHQFRAVGQ